MQISVLARKFRGEDQKKRRKKGLRRRENLGFALAFTRVFRPGTRLYSRLGGTSPEMHSGGNKPVTFFWGTFLAWGGAQAVIWGGKAPKCPRDAGP